MLRQQCCSRHGGEQPTEKAAPGFIGANKGRYFSLAEGFAPHVLGDVVELGKKEQINNQADGAARWVNRGWKHQKIRDMAQTKKRGHKRPMVSRGRANETICLTY